MYKSGCRCNDPGDTKVPVFSYKRSSKYSNFRATKVPAFSLSVVGNAAILVRPDTFEGKYIESLYYAM